MAYYTTCTKHWTARASGAFCSEKQNKFGNRISRGKAKSGPSAADASCWLRAWRSPGGWPSFEGPAHQPKRSLTYFRGRFRHSCPSALRKLPPGKSRSFLDPGCDPSGGDTRFSHGRIKRRKVLKQGRETFCCGSWRGGDTLVEGCAPWERNGTSMVGRRLRAILGDRTGAVCLTRDWTAGCCSRLLDQGGLVWV